MPRFNWTDKYRLTYDGRDQSLSEWAHEWGICYMTLWKRVRANGGWKAVVSRQGKPWHSQKFIAKRAAKIKSPHNRYYQKLAKQSAS